MGNLILRINPAIPLGRMASTVSALPGRDAQPVVSIELDTSQWALHESQRLGKPILLEGRLRISQFDKDAGLLLTHRHQDRCNVFPFYPGKQRLAALTIK